MARRAGLQRRQFDIAGPWATAAIASCVGIVMSTQFLAQPFVWRNWPVEEVLNGWVQIAADRIIVAVAIAFAVAMGRSIRAASNGIRALVLTCSILLGAIAGEFARSAIDPFGDHLDSWSMIGRIVQWSAVAGAIAGISMAWRAASAAMSAADEAELAQVQMRRATTLAQLETLRWQIEPHFLFNTLATVQRLGQTAPAEGLHLLTRLFDFITANLTSQGGDESSLAAELDLARAYLDVCGARMGPRLSVAWDVDETLRPHRFPRYVIGTLVENAIKHGISPKPEGGVVSIAVAAENYRIVVTVSDTGAGFQAQSGSGTGLANLADRLRLTYGDRADFSLYPAATGGVVARVRLPIDPGFGDD